jgi:hypothetical protein
MRMGILNAIKSVFQSPANYPRSEFGMDDMQFFIALLRACPEGSRLNFGQSESESFVHAFREWSHRGDPNSFEADSYSIDARFIAAVEREMASGKLELYAHFWIVSSDGRALCSSLDDFTVVTLSDDIKQRMSNQ